MNTSRIWDLMAKKLAAEASAAELQELELLLRSHPDINFPANTVAELWDKTTAANDHQSAAAAHDRHISRMQAMGIPIGSTVEEIPLLRTAGTNRRQYLWAAAAAAGLLLSLSAWWWFTSKKNAPMALSEVTTQNGRRTSVSLPDGTRIWLNAGSKLTYSKNFGKGSREVTLSGEAFFDVAKQAAHPFVIHTATMDIRVLGTRFNVRSYPDDKTAEAALISGSIEAIPTNKAAGKIILKPSEKIVVLNEIAASRPATALPAEKAASVTIGHLSYYAAKENAIAETSWLENKLVFKDESFTELAQQMERFYGVTIQFNDKQKETLRFTGIFDQETVQQALNALKLTASFDYAVADKRITIN